MGFIDLHSHILADLDDGAAGPEASLTLIRGLRDLGFGKICATPHQKAGQFLPSAEAIATAHQAATAAVHGAGLDVDIVLGAENMWDRVLIERITAKTIPCYGQGPAFLVEFPLYELPARILDHLFRLRVEGKLPVIAHPERYLPVQQSLAVAEELAETSALVVDLGAVAGAFGRRQARCARKLLLAGAAHAAASDAHRPQDLASVAEGMAWIRKKLGKDGLERLLAEAPRQILAGVHPRPPR